MKRVSGILLFWLLISCLIPGYGQTSGNTLLWEISGKGLKKPSYLFGTHHLIQDQYLNGAPKVKKAFSGAAQVVVEAEIDSSALMELGMLALMLDNRLSALMDSSGYALVSEELQRSTGYDLRMFEQLKPVTLTMMLTMLYAQQITAELVPGEGMPLDQYFAVAGKRAGKVIQPLETMQEQAKLLYNQHSPQEQANQLVDFVRDKEQMIRMQKDLTEMYLNGDIEAMWQLNTEIGDRWGDSAYLLDNRNQRWMQQLPAIIQQQATFIAVGALHLPGENGLINLLRQAGYKVKPVR
jgi:uncharacterized protein